MFFFLFLIYGIFFTLQLFYNIIIRISCCLWVLILDFTSTGKCTQILSFFLKIILLRDSLFFVGFLSLYITTLHFLFFPTALTSFQYYPDPTFQPFAKKLFEHDVTKKEATFVASVLALQKHILI